MTPAVASMYTPIRDLHIPSVWVEAIYLEGLTSQQYGTAAGVGPIYTRWDAALDDYSPLELCKDWVWPLDAFNVDDPQVLAERIRDLSLVLIRVLGEEDTGQPAPHYTGYAFAWTSSESQKWSVAEAYMRARLLPPLACCDLPAERWYGQTTLCAWLLNGCRRSVEVARARLNDLDHMIDVAAEAQVE